MNIIMKEEIKKYNKQKKERYKQIEKELKKDFGIEKYKSSFSKKKGNNEKIL